MEIEKNTLDLVNAIYNRKIADGWTGDEAADLCDWLLFVKPVDGEPREVTRMRGIRETCERHGMMDILSRADAKAEWDAVLFNANAVVLA
jgi:hypothetical protein